MGRLLRLSGYTNQGVSTQDESLPSGSVPTPGPPPTMTPETHGEGRPSRRLVVEWKVCAAGPTRDGRTSEGVLPGPLTTT